MRRAPTQHDQGRAASGSTCSDALSRPPQLPAAFDALAAVHRRPERASRGVPTSQPRLTAATDAHEPGGQRRPLPHDALARSACSQPGAHSCPTAYYSLLCFTSSTHAFLRATRRLARASPPPLAHPTAPHLAPPLSQCASRPRQLPHGQRVDAHLRLAHMQVFSLGRRLPAPDSSALGQRHGVRLLPLPQAEPRTQLTRAPPCSLFSMKGRVSAITGGGSGVSRPALPPRLPSLPSFCGTAAPRTRPSLAALERTSASKLL